MKLTKINLQRGAYTAFVLVAMVLFSALESRAQWTTPDANQNINNTNSGNVGVGTTTPNYKFDISNLVDKAQIRFGLGALDSGGYLFSNAPTHAVFSGGTSWDGTWKAKAMNASMVQLSGGSLMFFADTNLVTNSSYTPTERMRIASSGYVGIGTTLPSNKLHVVSGTDSGTTLLSLDTGIHGGTAMAVFGNASNQSGFDLSVQRNGSYVSRFGVTTDGNVYLQPGLGNVGIGTNNPNALYKLDVSGAIRSSTGGFVFPDGTTQTTAAVSGGTITGVTAGAGLSGGGSSGSVTLTNSDRGSLQSIFKNIANGSGTTQFMAASNNDTIRFAGTGGTTVSFDAATRKITFDSTATISGVTAGTGLSGGGTSGSVTLTNDDRGSSQSIFKNVANSAGATQFSAGSNNDAIRFAGTGGTSVTFDAATRKVTIDSSSGISTVTAGTGLSGGGSSSSITLTNDDRGSSQSIFKNVANSAGSTQFSAGSNSDAIRFAGAGGTTVSFDAGTKKVTIDGSTSTVSAANVTAGNFAGTAYTFGGDVTVTGTLQGGNIKAKYQDVAEWVESSQALTAGTVVVLDTANSNQVIASNGSYDSRVAGVISNQPGIALGVEGEGRVLVATTGRVKVRVDATNGPIQIGDLLVTSDRQGIAMKSLPVEIGGVRLHRPGTIIGKALEPLASGTGEILVLLSLQ